MMTEPEIKEFVDYAIKYYSNEYEIYKHSKNKTTKNYLEEFVDTLKIIRYKGDVPNENTEE